MKIGITICLALLVVSCARKAANEIGYRGERIKLTRSYSDFDDYKNDPQNIDPTETERVQRLVMHAPIEREFGSLLDVSKAVSEIAFPGYGSGGFAQQPQPDGSVLMGFSVEIPRAQKERCFAFRGVNGKYRLIDDFVAPDTPSIGRFSEENGTLVYSTASGERIVSRPLIPRR
jgi:hypothetical protein